MGGGLPVGALAGPTQYLDWLERHADVFHSGTFAANPVTMAGGIATLKQLRDGDPYELLEVLGAELDHRMSDALQDAGSPYGFIRRGSVFSLVLVPRSEEHTSELQSLMRIAYSVFCLRK